MSKADLLKQYNKPIVHMRQQFINRKFGLVFGSGISKPFKLPNWNGLIKQIAKNPEVNGEEILKYKKASAQASITQMIYEHYRAQELEKVSLKTNKITKECEMIIHQNWRNIIHKELWRDFKNDYLKKDHHPYIEPYIGIIKDSSLTINYNFDDILQTLINERRTKTEIDDGIKLYETVYDARLQFHLNSGIIYHPNGFLPQK
jgi:hypothetical protein